MSQDKRLLGYTRGLARLVLVPATVWAILVLIFFAPKLGHRDLMEFVILWPVFYWLATTLLAFVAAIRPPVGIIKRHVICGILVGTLLAYALQCLMFASNDPGTWRDGIFQWAVFCLPFFWVGPPLGFVAVTIHLATFAIRSRFRRNPT